MSQSKKKAADEAAKKTAGQTEAAAQAATVESGQPTVEGSAAAPQPATGNAAETAGAPTTSELTVTDEQPESEEVQRLKAELKAKEEQLAFYELQLAEAEGIALAAAEADRDFWAGDPLGLAARRAAEMQKAISEPGVVKVYCKLPSGLDFPLDKVTQGVDGYLGPVLKLNGSASKNAVCGFGVTERVPFDTWQQVERLYARHPAIVNQLVFAGSDDEAKEKAGLKTGLEPLNPKKPGPRPEKYKND